MKKMMAVLLASTFVMGVAIAQTPAPAKPQAEKSGAAAQAPAAKKDEQAIPKAEKMKKHKGKKHKAKKAEMNSTDAKVPEKK